MLKQLLFTRLPAVIAATMILALFSPTGIYGQGIGTGQSAYHNQRGEEFFRKGFYDHAPKSQAAEAERQYGLAVKEFQTALSHDPSSLAAHRNLARVYFVQKSFAGAAREYRMVTRLAPTDLDAYVNLALALIELGKPEEAIQALEEAKGQTTDPKAQEKLDSYVAKVRAHQEKGVR